MSWPDVPPFFEANSSRVAARPGSPQFGGRLGRAGLLHQKYMGADNHRRYPLRAAKGLRRSADLLLPVGPFFDAWGRRVGRRPSPRATRALSPAYSRCSPADAARSASSFP
jgi:hypothetical protein